VAVKKILVAGRTNVGKSALAVTLARFLGMNTLQLTWQDYQGQRRTYKYNFALARRKLVAASEFYTNGLYTINVELSKLTRWQLVDTTGLTDVVHPVEKLRRCMAMTIAAIGDCDCLIHVYDADYYSEQQFSEVDCSLMGLETVSKYIPVANKADSMKASAGLQRIKSLLGEAALPCSCVTGQGMVALRQILLQSLKI